MKDLDKLRKNAVIRFYQEFYSNENYSCIDEIVSKNYEGSFINYPSIHGYQGLKESLVNFHSDFSHISLLNTQFYFNDFSLYLLATMSRKRKPGGRSLFMTVEDETLSFIDIFNFEDDCKIKSRQHAKIRS